jgi:hypothetical protein
VSDETPEERVEDHALVVQAIAEGSPATARWLLDTYGLGYRSIGSHLWEPMAERLIELQAEVDRLRHGEKVRDGEVCGQWCSLHASTADLDDDRCAYRRHWSVSGECTFSPVYREVAVLAALDTEEDTEQ